MSACLILALTTHTPDVGRMIVAGRLYVGIIGSHSDKTLFNADIPGACLVGP
jgi:hypothetical protein